MTKTVEYFLAPQSPYAYLGHDRFVSITKKAQATVLIKPFDVAKIFSLSGGVPVAQRPLQRQAYRLVELQRWSSYLNKPFVLQPAFFPVSGDPGSKLIIAAQQAYGTEKALALAGALGSAIWAEEKNITDLMTLEAIASNLKLDGAKLVAALESDAVLKSFNQHTEEAIAAKVFGVPWYRIDGEDFWGQDRLDFVERALNA
ncbi:MAG: 2-hydroxychromene-2-carboxylate isomerase [Burkholderiales bacterium]|jgi:2-hydroxychromene-2-carboxylate isomerase|nr:2-hydroxychromene-2-carboxylate isomerase [Burkholderiales bacterium]